MREFVKGAIVGILLGSVIGVLAAVKEVCTSNHDNALGEPPQSQLWENGYYVGGLCVPLNSGTVIPDVAYALISDHDFGAAHDIPNISANNIYDGSDVSVAVGQRNAWWGAWVAAVSDGTNTELEFDYKANGTIISSNTMGVGTTRPMDNYPNVIIDLDSRVWIAGREGTNLVADHAGDYLLGGWSTHTLAVLGGSEGRAQPIPFYNGDTGFCYSVGNTLYYKHYTLDVNLIGSASTLTTDLAQPWAYKCLPVRKDSDGVGSVMAFWRASSDNDLDYITGTYNESKEGAHQGAVNGSVIWHDGSPAGECVSGGCIEFDPTGSEYTSFANSVISDIKDLTEGTIIFKIYVDDYSSQTTFFSFGTDGTSIGRALQLFVKTDGVLRVFHRNNETGPSYDGYILADGSTTLSTGTWYNVAWSVDSSGNILCVGTSAESMSYTNGSASDTYFLNDIVSTTNIMYHGIRWYNGSLIQPWDGRIDRVAVLNRKISCSENTDGLPLSSDSGLVALWKYDDGSGSVADDDVKQHGIDYGSTSQLASDLGGTSLDAYFTGTADWGHDDTAYVAYYDGTDIDYIKWDGSWGNPVQLVASAAPGNSRMSAPLMALEEIPVAYAASDDDVQVEIIDLTPADSGADGDLLSSDGHPVIGTWPVAWQMLTYGDKALNVFLTRSGRVAVNRYDYAGSSFDFAWKYFGTDYWDGHNSTGIAVCSDGTAYLFYGGRSAHNTTTGVIVMQSDYALNDGSFTNDPSDWTQLTGISLSGRGYKWGSCDSNNVFHLFFITGGGGSGTIVAYNYNGTSWDGPHTLASFTGSNEYLYFYGFENGTEGSCEGVSNQNCIHMFYGYLVNGTDPEPPIGSILHRGVFYMKLAYQTDRSYKGYEADRTEITLPATSSTTNDVYTAAGGLYARLPWNRSATLIDNDTPAVSFMEWDNNAGEINALLFYKWSGSAWTKITVDSTGPFTRYGATPVVLRDSTTGNIWLATEEAVGGEGDSEIFRYLSEDDGDTWGARQRVTTTPWDSSNPLLSPRNDANFNLLYHERAGQIFSEVRLTPFSITPSLGGLTCGLINMLGAGCVR